MKNQLLKTLFLAGVASLAISACGPKEPDYGAPEVKASPASMEFGVEGGTQTVTLKATVKWTASTSQTWVTLDQMSGVPSTNDQTITVNVARNNDLERVAEIVFVSEDSNYKSVVAISQGAYVPSEILASNSNNFKTNDVYKYQKIRVSGVVKALKADGSFNLVDDMGIIAVAGLNASEQPYGTQGGKLDNVKERDNVVVVGYRVVDDGKPILKYAWVETVTPYTEPDPSNVAVRDFPYIADFTMSDFGAIVNNPVFPVEFESIWSYDSNGWTASGYKNKSYTTKSCLYSEKINLKDAEKPVFTFQHRVTNFYDYIAARAETSIWISKDGGEWIKLPVSAYSYPTEKEFAMGEIIPSEEISLEAYKGSVIQLMFVYTSDASGEAGTWQISKFAVNVPDDPSQPDNSTGTDDYNKPDWNWN